MPTQRSAETTPDPESAIEIFTDAPSTDVVKLPAGRAKSCIEATEHAIDRYQFRRSFHLPTTHRMTHKRAHRGGRCESSDFGVKSAIVRGPKLTSLRYRSSHLRFYVK